MSGKIVAIGNLKGGTGKTTIAVNLCGALADGAGHPVALVDADHQASAPQTQDAELRRSLA